jgi:RNA polymerase sigma factor (sigma-70 family)
VYDRAVGASDRELLARWRAGDTISGEALFERNYGMVDVAPGPSSLIGRRREHGLLIEALRTIAVDDQVILELHYWQQLTTHEMAEVIGLPLGTARGRLQPARAKLDV